MDYFKFDLLNCPFNLCSLINMTFTTGMWIVYDPFSCTWHILTNQLGVNKRVHGAVYWKKKSSACNVSIGGERHPCDTQVGHKTHWDPTEKVSQQKPRNSFLHSSVCIFFGRCRNTHARDFLVCKYIDDHHIYEEHEVECDEKGGIFKGTFTGRGIETWHANTYLRIKPKLCFYFIVFELAWNGFRDFGPRLKCGICLRNLIGDGDEVIFGNCVSFEEMVGKPNFRHKITRFQWNPWKKSEEKRK